MKPGRCTPAAGADQPCGGEQAGRDRGHDEQREEADGEVDRCRRRAARRCCGRGARWPPAAGRWRRRRPGRRRAARRARCALAPQRGGDDRRDRRAPRRRSRPVVTPWWPAGLSPAPSATRLPVGLPADERDAEQRDADLRRADRPGDDEQRAAQAAEQVPDTHALRHASAARAGWRRSPRSPRSSATRPTPLLTAAATSPEPIDSPSRPLM